ncbi:hypothetical protein [Streptomyces sp. NPDC055287]
MQLTDEEWEYIEPHLPVGRFGPYPEHFFLVRLRPVRHEARSDPPQTGPDHQEQQHDRSAQGQRGQNAEGFRNERQLRIGGTGKAGKDRATEGE